MGWDRKKRPFRVYGLRASSGIKIDSGGLVMPVVAAATTVAQLGNQGVSHITATTAGKNFVLGLPAAGAFKIIAPNSTLAFTVTCVANSYFMGATGAPSLTRKATFNGANDALTLIGYSTAAWGVIGNQGSISLAGT